MGRIGLEACSLTAWLHDGLRAEGLPAIGIETQAVNTAMKTMPNKTDRNDARTLPPRACLGRTLSLSGTRAADEALARRSSARRRCVHDAAPRYHQHRCQAAPLRSRAAAVCISKP